MTVRELVEGNADNLDFRIIGEAGHDRDELDNFIIDIFEQKVKSWKIEHNIIVIEISDKL